MLGPPLRSCFINLALELLQFDQVVDRGSWTLAAELSLENVPPMNALNAHVGPSVVGGELPYSKLLDYIAKRCSVGRKLAEQAEESAGVSARRKMRPKAIAIGWSAAAGARFEPLVSPTVRVPDLMNAMPRLLLKHGAVLRLRDRVGV